MLTIDSEYINIIGRNPDSTRQTSHGGGIDIRSGGEFILNGGTIRNISGLWRNNAVHARDGGTFTMNGGIVENNRSNHGGGISITGANARFILNNGLIQNNFATSHGGGVDVDARATFNMYGGIITNNTASLSGGGIRVDSRGVVNMHGGIISHNIANGGSNTGGGGVAIFDNDSRFNLYYGTIYGNIATRDSGGGVRINSGGLFNMFDGVIENNHVTNDGRYPYGGGVALFHAGSTFNFNGGKIRNNSAHRGGGVAAWEAVFNMGTGHVARSRANHSSVSEGTPIIEYNRSHGGGTGPVNTVGGAGGGGVFVYGMNASRNNINFIMNSGYIINNSSNLRGGGVFLNAANFRQNGGSITGNRTDLNDYNGNMGGGIFLHDHIAGSFPASFVIHGGTLSQNFAVNGGAIARTNNRLPITISGGTISSNEALEAGGAIFVNSSTNLELNTTNIRANRNNLNLGQNVNFYGNTARESSLGLTHEMVSQLAPEFLHKYHLLNNHVIDNNVGVFSSGINTFPSVEEGEYFIFAAEGEYPSLDEGYDDQTELIFAEEGQVPEIEELYYYDEEIIFAEDGQSPKLYFEYLDYGSHYFVDENSYMDANDYQSVVATNIGRITIQYRGNGHTYGSVPGSHTHHVPSFIILRDQGNMARAGYRFVGWSDGWTTFLGGQGINVTRSGSIMLSAVWQRNVSTITIQYRGGGHTHGHVPASHTHNVPSFINLRDQGNMTRTGYRFVGWSDGWNTFRGGQRLEVTGSGLITLTAVW